MVSALAFQAAYVTLQGVNVSMNHSLRRASDIALVHAKGRRLYEGSVGLKWMKHDQAAPTAFAMLVGKKVSKKAVVRNVLRRRIREIMRELYPRMKPGFHVLVVTKPGAETLEFDELQERITQLCARAHLLQ